MIGERHSGSGGPASEEDALTARAIAAGLCAGALLALGNLTVGLATGIWDSGQITASLIAFALAQLWPRRRGRFSPRENDVAQTLACACAAMPAAMGLLGAIPALQQLGLSLRAPGVLAWLFALGVSAALLGAGLAFALARRLLDEEQLPFPTGAATAQLISALHGDGAGARLRTRALLLCGALSLALVFLRDVPGAIPQALFLPGPLALSLLGPQAAWIGMGVALDPLLWGVGAVIGARTASSLALGALAAWAFGAPRLLAHGVTPDALSPFLVWPGVALLAGATLIDLLAHSASLLRSLGDLRGAARGAAARFLLPAGALASLALFAAHQALGLGFSAGLLALLLFAPLCAMVARAAGQTDVAPISQSGQLTQAAMGPLLHAAPIADVAAGALVAGGAAETSSLLWSLRAGRELGASARTQAWAALLGIAAGALFSLPAYLLLIARSPLGSPQNPAPGAAQWRAIAALVTQGLSALPAGGLSASAACLALGLLLALGHKTRLTRFLPSPVALGIGFLIPPTASFAMLLGGLAAWAFARTRPKPSEQLLPSIAGGLIAGESLLAFALAAAGALGLR